MECRDFELAFVDCRDTKVDTSPWLPDQAPKTGEAPDPPCLDLEGGEVPVESEIPEEEPPECEEPGDARRRRSANDVEPGGDLRHRQETARRTSTPSRQVIGAQAARARRLGLHAQPERDERHDIDGKPYEGTLRFSPRVTFRYTMPPDEVTHDVYDGTDKPKDSRHVTYRPGNRHERDVEIYMNARCATGGRRSSSRLPGDRTGGTPACAAPR